MVRAPHGEVVGDFFRTSVRRDPAALFELIEVRRAVEVHNAALAARLASYASLPALEAAMAEMDAATADEDAFHAADVRFHEALAVATGNAMLIYLVEGLAEPLRMSRRHSWRGRESEPRPLEPVIAAHRAILERVLARDPDGAAAAMRAHLDATERDLQANCQPGRCEDRADRDVPGAAPLAAAAASRPTTGWSAGASRWSRAAPRPCAPPSTSSRRA